MLKHINLGDAHIPSYNLFIAIGIALAMFWLQYDKWFLLRTDKEKNNIHLSLVLSVILGFSGAFVFDAYTQDIPLHPKNFKRIGLTFFSGLITGILLLVLFFKLFRLPVTETLNNLTPYFCIAHFFGRIGCFFAGCCYGAPTETVFGVRFPEGSLPHLHYQEAALHPTQLYEGFFALLIFLFLKLKKPRQPFFIYLSTYSVFRFNVEFFRADNRGAALGQDIFTPSQVLSLVTLGMVLIILKFQRKQQAGTT